MIDIDNLQLQHKCPNCQGAGEIKATWYVQPHMEKCSECRGFGYKLNALGEEILELVKSRLRFEVRTETNE